MKKTLSERAIQGLQPDPEKVLYYYDKTLHGFGLRLQPSGKAFFFIQYREPGTRKVRRKTLAPWPAAKVVAARKKAHQLLSQIALKDDPFAQAAEGEALPSFTIAQAAALYLERHGPKKKPSSLHEDQRLLDKKILPALGSLPLQDLNRPAVAAFHAQVSKEAPGSANRCLALLSKMFSLCITWGYVEEGTPNPAKGIERNPEKKLGRVLTPDELNRLGKALNILEGQGSILPGLALGIRLILLTGARRGEIFNLTWDSVELDQGLLALPDSKTGRKVIHLPQAAIALLQDAPRRPGDDYVCLGKGFNRPISGFGNPWARILKEAGLKGVRMHDLRHGFITYGGQAGYSLQLLGTLVGHKTAGITERYTHVQADPLKRAAEDVGGRIAEQIGLKPA